MVRAGRHHTRHEHHRRDHGVHRGDGAAGRSAVRCAVRGARSEGAGVMTSPATDATEHQFVSRRTLVWRRFLRNRPAVISLIVLAVLFLSCYALPPLLPFSHTELDYYALQQPPTTTHWFGTNALGQ